MSSKSQYDPFLCSACKERLPDEGAYFSARKITEESDEEGYVEYNFCLRCFYLIIGKNDCLKIKVEGKNDQ